MTKKTFYLIENNRCVSWISGTDIPNDPSSTKAKVDAWVVAGMGRSVIEKEEPVANVPSKHLVVENGDIRPMTEQEALAADKAVKDAEDAREAKRAAKSKKVRDGIMAKLTAPTYTPLDQDEAKWLTHRLDLDA